MHVTEANLPQGVAPVSGVSKQPHNAIELLHDIRLIPHTLCIVHVMIVVVVFVVDGGGGGAAATTNIDDVLFRIAVVSKGGG